MTSKALTKAEHAVGPPSVSQGHHASTDHGRRARAKGFDKGIGIARSRTPDPHPEGAAPAGTHTEEIADAPHE